MDKNPLGSAATGSTTSRFCKRKHSKIVTNAPQVQSAEGIPVAPPKIYPRLVRGCVFVVTHDWFGIVGNIHIAGWVRLRSRKGPASETSGNYNPCGSTTNKKPPQGGIFICVVAHKCHTPSAVPPPLSRGELDECPVPLALRYSKVRPLRFRTLWVLGGEYPPRGKWNYLLSTLEILSKNTIII